MSGLLTFQEKPEIQTPTENSSALMLQMNLKKKKTSFLKHCVGKNRHTGNTQTCTRAHTHIFGLDLVYRLSA